MRLAALFSVSPLAVLAANGGHNQCPCKDTPIDGSQVATQAVGKPSYPTQDAAYGYGCAAHDSGHDLCATSNKTAAGEDDDWCEDHWCIVDPADCDFRALHVSYTGQPDDFFSYEACDLAFGTSQATFMGNGWVGRCKNCAHMTTGSDRTGDDWEQAFCQCNGHNQCPCLPGGAKASQATDKPAYPGEVPAYGWGCKAHDAGYASCNGTDTSAGMPDDWCADQWCRVDPADCDYRALHISYTAQADDFFSYEACDKNFGTPQATFMGNGWVGRCKNCAHMTTGSDRTGDDWEQAFCQCGGLPGCPCIEMVKQATQASGKPAYPASLPSYGYGCKAHDSGHDMCATSSKTAEGQDDDWCEDQWCIVDPNNCDLTSIAVTYTGDVNDEFVYGTCDSNFDGNGWVGRCADGAGWTACPTPAPSPPDADVASKVVPTLVGGVLLAAVSL